MNNLLPFTRKEIFHIDSPVLWDHPAYRSGMEPLSSLRLTILPIETGKEISLREGNTLLKIGINGIVEFMTAQAGYMACQLDSGVLASIPYTKKWKGRLCEPNQVLMLPTKPEILFSFSPDIVDFAVLLCHGNDEYYLLVARKGE